MYFLCNFSFYKPLEFAVLSAVTMMSFVPTGVFPGKVFILKKCHFPMKKKKNQLKNSSLVLYFELIHRFLLPSRALHTQEILNQTPKILQWPCTSVHLLGELKYTNVGLYSNWRGTKNCPCSFVLAHPAQRVLAQVSSSSSGCFLRQKLATFGRSSTEAAGSALVICGRWGLKHNSNGFF